MGGPTFVSWLDRAESFHRVLMREAKLMPGATPPAVTAAASAPKPVR
jgi:hypothetical protein